MPDSYRLLDVQQTGPRCVVGLKSDRVSDETVIMQLFDEFDHLLRTENCDVLVIDIAGLQSLPSSFIGHLVNLRRRIRIELDNPSDYVQLVLETSRLSKLFEPEAGSRPAV